MLSGIARHSDHRRVRRLGPPTRAELERLREQAEAEHQAAEESKYHAGHTVAVLNGVGRLEVMIVYNPDGTETTVDNPAAAMEAKRQNARRFHEEACEEYNRTGQRLLDLDRQLRHYRKPRVSSRTLSCTPRLPLRRARASRRARVAARVAAKTTSTGDPDPEGPGRPAAQVTAGLGGAL